MKGISGDNPRLTHTRRGKGRKTAPVKKNYQELLKELDVLNIERSLKRRHNTPCKQDIVTGYSMKNTVSMNPYERIFMNKLVTLNIEYEPQKVYRNDKYYYIVDFFLPDYNTCVEIDGAYHDAMVQRKKDAHKDEFLTSNGIKVLRIESKNLGLIKLGDIKRKLKKMKHPKVYYLG